MRNKFCRVRDIADFLSVSDERALQNATNHQRRRNPISFEPRIMDVNGNCLSEPRPGENGVFVDDTAVSDNYASLPQHRTIPTALGANADPLNIRPNADGTSSNNRLFSSHKSKLINGALVSVFTPSHLIRRTFDCIISREQRV